MSKVWLDKFWWFLQPSKWWIRHLLFWIYRFNNYLFYGIGLQKLDLSEGGVAIAGELLLYIFFVYAHLLILIPKYLFKNKILFYAICTIVSLISFAYLENYFFPNSVNGSFFEQYHDSFFLGIETYLQITGLRIIIEFIYAQKKVAELQTENYKTELAYLKNQINPHFLFNTLNNIATLSEYKPKQVTPVIVALGNVLRYQIYESEKQEVDLKKEIENLQQYINLEALRANDPDFKIEVQGDTNGIKVAPLLFIPFVENAVKHGANATAVSSIKILFIIENKKIIFNITNTKPTEKNVHLQGGLGLKNIQRRLELLYPNRHNLDIEYEANYYKVHLTINT